MKMKDLEKDLEKSVGEIIIDLQRKNRDLERELENIRELSRQQSKAFDECLKDYRELVKDYMKQEEENKKLKEKIKRLEFDVDAWHQLKLLLEGEIERLKGLQICGKTVVERIEDDKKVVRE